jgi:hypothetical protein
LSGTCPIIGLNVPLEFSCLILIVLVIGCNSISKPTFLNSHFQANTVLFEPNDFFKSPKPTNTWMGILKNIRCQKQLLLFQGDAELARIKK